MANVARGGCLAPTAAPSSSSTLARQGLRSRDGLQDPRHAAEDTRHRSLGKRITLDWHRKSGSSDRVHGRSSHTSRNAGELRWYSYCTLPNQPAQTLHLLVGLNADQYAAEMRGQLAATGATMGAVA